MQVDRTCCIISSVEYDNTSSRHFQTGAAANAVLLGAITGQVWRLCNEHENVNCYDHWIQHSSEAHTSEIILFEPLVCCSLNNRPKMNLRRDSGRNQFLMRYKNRHSTCSSLIRLCLNSTAHNASRTGHFSTCALHPDNLWHKLLFLNTLLVVKLYRKYLKSF